MLVDQKSRSLVGAELEAVRDFTLQAVDEEGSVHGSMTTLDVVCDESLCGGNSNTRQAHGHALPALPTAS